MVIRKKLLEVAVLFLTFCFGFSSDALAQPAEIELSDRKLFNVDIDAPTILVALSQLSDQQKIPIGFEFAVPDTVQSRRKIYFSADKSSISNVLDEITGQDGRFVWQFAGRVIHVRPNESFRVTCIERLLTLPVDNFTAARRSTYLGIRSKLYSLPGFRERVSDCGFEIDRSVIPSQDFSVVLPNFDLTWRNTTVRGILDDIIIKSDSKFWVVNRTGENENFLFINF